MTPKENVLRCLYTLKKIECGEMRPKFLGQATLTHIANTFLEVNINDIYCGHAVYTCKNWYFVVFISCGGWGYLKSFTTPEGKTVDFPFGYDGEKYEELEEEVELINYSPPVHVIKKIWGIGDYKSGLKVDKKKKSWKDILCFWKKF